MDSSQPFFHMIRSRAVANNEYLWDNPQKFPEMEKIIIASDSFKGSLSSEEVSDAAAMAIHEVFPDCTVEKIPVADGGEGTSEALMKILGGEMVHLTVHDPLMRPVHASYGITVDGHTAIIDMAQASGLDLLSKEERNPMEATSFGTGEIIADAIRRGCKKIITGLGGSATNDAGMGLLSALGVRFLDKDGHTLEGKGKDIGFVADIDLSQVPDEISGTEFTIACDVRNPFCGPCGAAAVFAPQKGADKNTVDLLDRGMETLAETILRKYGKDISRIPGSGAAGGTAGTMAALLDAKIVPGAELVLGAAGFDARLKDADLVITGEGRIDRQTQMGKIPYAVLLHAKEYGIPVIAIAGSVEDGLEDNLGFDAIIPAAKGPATLEESMQKTKAAENVRNAVFQVMRLIKTVRLRKSSQ